MNHPLPSESAETLLGLLDAHLHLPAEYQDQLTSHVPMALHALCRLGASPARMQAFYDRYAQRFGSRLAEPPGAVVCDWVALLGQENAYPALHATMAALLARDGVDATLRSVLPALLPGVAAAAFHGLIRTAHAVETGHVPELAAALAYWAWRWQPLAAPDHVAPALAFAPWSQRLVREAPSGFRDGPLISIRMGLATQTPVYRVLAAALQPATDIRASVARLAAWAAERYAGGPNFTVLHMITGLRAVRVLLPWLAGASDVQALLVRAITAAYLAARVKELPIAPEPQLHTWPEVIAAAMTSDDDHVIKLVDACREETAVYGEGHYLRVAGLVLL